MALEIWLLRPGKIHDISCKALVVVVTAAASAENIFMHLVNCVHSTIDVADQYIFFELSARTAHCKKIIC